MQKINLRDLYPDVYKTDVFVDVAEEVLSAIRDQQQGRCRLRTPEVPVQGTLFAEPWGRHENDALNQPPTPEEILEQKQLREEVYAALMQLLLLQDFLRGRRLVEGIIFNAVPTVQRIMCLVPELPAFVGGIVLLLVPDRRQDFLGYIYKDIRFIHIGIQIPKIDLLHYVPPFRFTG